MYGRIIKLSNITIIHDDPLGEIYCKIMFKDYMSEYDKNSLKSDWEKFKKQVDKNINLIKIPGDKDD